MESGAINDSRISASSSFDIYHGPPRARLHTKKTSSGKGAWSSKIADAHQWIQVDLVELKNVTYIATQGRNGVNQYVTMYKLEKSSDGVNFTSYKMQGDSSATVSRFCRLTTSTQERNKRKLWQRWLQCEEGIQLEKQSIRKWTILNYSIKFLFYEAASLLKLVNTKDRQNRAFHSWVFSCLAFDREWGWCWPCFGRKLPAFLSLIVLFSC